MFLRSAILGLLVPLLASSAGSPPAESGQEEKALAALDAFLAAADFGREEVVLGMVGFYGEPAPPQWLILTAEEPKAGVLRESVFARGKVRAERRFRRLPGQELPTIPLRREELRIDSGEAFRIVEEVARSEKVAFDSVHYQLRCREAESEPVWMLNLISPAQVSLGVVYLSARSGEVLRVSWVRPPMEGFATTPREE